MSHFEDEANQEKTKHPQTTIGLEHNPHKKLSKNGTFVRDDNHNLSRKQAAPNCGLATQLIQFSLSLAKVATARTKQSTGKKQILMAAPGALHVLLVNLLVVGRISSKPYFDLGTSYEDMMRSVGRLCSYFGKSPRKISGFLVNWRGGGLKKCFALIFGSLMLSKL